LTGFACLQETKKASFGQEQRVDLNKNICPHRRLLQTIDRKGIPPFPLLSSSQTGCSSFSYRRGFHFFSLDEKKRNKEKSSQNEPSAGRFDKIFASFSSIGKGRARPAGGRERLS